MSRKILKVLISLLFLAVAAVAAVLGIKNFFPGSTQQRNPNSIIPARKTPAFKKDKQEQEKNNEEPRPVYRQIPEDMTDKYGVAPVNNLSVEQQKQIEREIKMREQYVTKYGVAPVQRPPRDMSLKYGVSPVQREKLLEKAKEIREQNVSKYGVAPVNGSTWQYEDKNIKN